MDDYRTYGYKDTFKFTNIQRISQQLNKVSQYDVKIANRNNGSFINITEVGDIDLFVNDMCCIKILKDNKIAIHANSLEVSGNTKIKSYGEKDTNGYFELKSDKDGTEITHKADNISIKTSREGYIGGENAVLNIEGKTVNIDTDDLYINGKKFIPYN